MTENRFGKYLLYAVGEVLLVVIGILIALQVDNWNQKRIQETRLKVLLGEIQKDLLIDIKKSKEIVQSYEAADTTLYRIIHRHLNKDNLRSYRYAPLFVAIGAIGEGFYLTKDGYNDFITYANEIQFDKSELQNELKEVYIHLDRSLNLSEEQSLRFSLSHLEHLAEEEEWYSNLVIGGSQFWDGYSNYVLNNPKFRGRALNFASLAGVHLRHVRLFQHKAFTLYKTLSTEVGNETEIPGEVLLLFQKIPDSIGQKAIGIYRNERNIDIELRRINDTLFFIQGEGKFPLMLRYDGRFLNPEAGMTVNLLGDDTIFVHGYNLGFMKKN